MLWVGLFGDSYSCRLFCFISDFGWCCLQVGFARFVCLFVTLLVLF